MVPGTICWEYCAAISKLQSFYIDFEAVIALQAFQTLKALQTLKAFQVESLKTQLGHKLPHPIRKVS